MFTSLLPISLPMIFADPLPICCQFDPQVEKEGYNTAMQSVQVNNYAYMVQQLDFTLTKVADNGGRAPPTAASFIAVVMATMLGLFFQRWPTSAWDLCIIQILYAFL